MTNIRSLCNTLVACALVASLCAVGGPPAMAIEIADPLPGDLVSNKPGPTATAGMRVCSLPNVPNDAVITVIGVHEGTLLPTRKVLDPGGGHARINVAVTRTDRPTILVLSSVNSVEWRIGRDERAKIAGVFATGLGEAVVTGLPRSVPLVVHGTGRTSGNAECEREGVPRFAADDLLRTSKHAVPAIKHVVGRLPDEWKTGYDQSEVTVGTPPPDPEKLLFSTERGPVFETDPDLIFEDEAGIEQLVERGALRRATADDINLWAAGYIAHHGTAPNIEHVPGPETYVILKETELPPGLAGAHSKLFIVPAGVPAPAEAPGHSMILVTDGYRCLGPLCR